MSKGSALVGNAGDRQQIRKAKKEERERRVHELHDLRTVLATVSGRRVLWRLLDHCGVFRSIWHPSALIHFNEGKRDTGLWLMGEIAAADESAFLRMMAEGRVPEPPPEKPVEPKDDGDEKTDDDENDS
jgi:hypothetical protein